MIKVGSKIRVKPGEYNSDARFIADVFVVESIQDNIWGRTIIVNANGKSTNGMNRFYFTESKIELVEAVVGRCEICDALTPGRTICCECKSKADKQ